MHLHRVNLYFDMQCNRGKMFVKTKLTLWSFKRKYLMLPELNCSNFSFGVSIHFKPLFDINFKKLKNDRYIEYLYKIIARSRGCSLLKLH